MAFCKYELYYGRILSMSKSRYRKENNTYKIMYYVSIIHNKYDIVWEGDLNIIKDMKILENIIKEAQDEL